MTLDDPIWKTLQGGYKMDYDVSIPLKQFEKASDSKEFHIIFDELWNELHHQGDVGLASYLALPHLVRIARDKRTFGWNVLSLCAVIEQQRHLSQNPSLPDEFLDYYQEGLNDLRNYVIEHLLDNMDKAPYTVSLAVLATCRGDVKLGKAILELLSEDVLDEFLLRF